MVAWRSCDRGRNVRSFLLPPYSAAHGFVMESTEFNKSSRLYEIYSFYK